MFFGLFSGALWIHHLPTSSILGLLVKVTLKSTFLSQKNPVTCRQSPAPSRKIRKHCLLLCRRLAFQVFGLWLPLQLLWQNPAPLPWFQKYLHQAYRENTELLFLYCYSISSVNPWCLTFTFNALPYTIQILFYKQLLSRDTRCRDYYIQPNF